MTTVDDDRELAELIRATLRENAESAPAHLSQALTSATAAAAQRGTPTGGDDGAAPVGPRSAARPTGGHRSRRWLPVALAAAVTAGTLALAIELPRPDRHSLPGGPTTGSTTGDSRPFPLPPGWRTESYRGLSLGVPPTWGWGGAPVRTDGGWRDCGATAAAVLPTQLPSDGTANTSPNPESPFVGRPDASLGGCSAEVAPAALPTPRGDALWFDSPYSAQAVGLPRRTETREYNGVRLTVFSNDSELRARIFATVQVLPTGNGSTTRGHDGNGCPTALPRVIGVEVRTPRGLAVCVYDEGRLLWSGHRDAANAQTYVRDVRRAGANYDVAACRYVPAARQVWIGVQSDKAEETRWDRVDFGCGWLIHSYLAAGPGGRGVAGTSVAPLQPRTVRPWGGEGLRAYVDSPLSALATGEHPYFRRARG